MKARINYKGEARINYKGGYTTWGSLSDEQTWTQHDLSSLKNVPRLLGECVWTLCTDNLFKAHPGRITKLVRLP